ncbi:MAG: DUF1738 domain-containing protein [Planctomycetes bacterium]|nr:DUF1738 domain-containing protein [Planctomycetota bacterium]MBI3833392.1 DUF1738 domain-containing protein [Planctomycetota bacterium]
MKAEEAKKIVDQGLETLAAALECGQSESMKTYLTAMGRFHDYSWGNVLLIVSQKPDATRVAGFNAWKKLNRFVKKGEKGIAIIAPMMIKPKEDQPPPTNGDERSILRFKAVYVFDVNQTDGDPLPEFAQVGGTPNGHTDRLKALVAAHGITLEYAESLGGANGCSRGGHIQLLSALSPAEEFSVLTHELAHEILHWGEDRSQSSKKLRETEAEAVAYVVCQAIGLETGSAAADYIQLYQGDKETLAESLGRIQRTSAAILEAVLGEPEPATEITEYATHSAV